MPALPSVPSYALRSRATWAIRLTRFFDDPDRTLTELLVVLLPFLWHLYPYCRCLHALGELHRASPPAIWASTRSPFSMDQAKRHPTPSAPRCPDEGALAPSRSLIRLTGIYTCPDQSGSNVHCGVVTVDYLVSPCYSISFQISCGSMLYVQHRSIEGCCTAALSSTGSVAALPADR